MCIIVLSLACTIRLFGVRGIKARGGMLKCIIRFHEWPQKEHRGKIYKVRRHEVYRIFFHEQVLEIKKATCRSMGLVFTEVPAAAVKHL